MIATDESLLERISRSPTEDAWREFYEIYWRPILGYAQRLGLNYDQAQDVLQETMVVLIRIMPGFRYDRRKGMFRNFLLTIVHRKTLTRLRRVKRMSEVPFEQLQAVPDAEPIADALVAEKERERWRESLMEEALRRLRAESGSKDSLTIDVFFRYVVEGESAGAVAREFNLKENAIYQIKNRMMRRLKADVAILMRDSGV